MKDTSAKLETLDELFVPEDWEDVDPAASPIRAPRRSRLHPRREAGWQERPRDTAPTDEAAPIGEDTVPVAATPMPVAEAPGAPPPARLDPWSSLPLVQPRARRNDLGGLALAHHHRDGPVSRAFDLLRTRLVHTLRQNGWTRIAVAAPTPGCGTTFTAVNLAMALSRVPGSRSILIDLNQRHPGIAAALGLMGKGEIRHFLSGEVPLGQHFARLSDTLALGLTSSAFADSADILHDRRCAQTLTQMHAALGPDVVLYDMPAVLDYDDLGAFLPQVDGVLLISDATQTTARHVAECEKVLAGQAPLLGVILNRARTSSLRRRGR